MANNTKLQCVPGETEQCVNKHVRLMGCCDRKMASNEDRHRRDWWSSQQGIAWREGEQNTNHNMIM